MSVRDVVMLGRHHQLRHNFLVYATGYAAVTRSERNDREECRKALKMLSIADIENRQLEELPYGVIKRVDLARAIVQQPAVLLLDEPASGLSQDERREMSAVLKQIRETFHIAMIVVEHDMNFVKMSCDRVAVLQEGVKIADDSCDNVLSDPRVMNAFLAVEES
jgi:branched-chain amino acid transport system ATP-binding protein